MEVSHYIISANYKDRVIIYNTLTTALITLDPVTYKDIFISKCFNDKGVTDTLHALGFLVNSNKEQLELIEGIRRAEIESNKQRITIFTTNRCNARCYYCFEKGIKFTDMTIDTANNILSFIYQNFKDKKLAIMWFGGEPLLSQDIIEYMTLNLKEKGYLLKTHITTNGSLISKQCIDFLKRHYYQISFQVTIDDIGLKYGKIKRYVDIPDEKAYQIIIENCKMLLDNNIPLSIRINYLPNKIETAKTIYLTLKDTFQQYEGDSLRIYLAGITLSEGCYSCQEKEKEIKDLLSAMEFAYEQRLYNPRAKDKREKELSTYCLLPKSYACAACRKTSIVVDAEGNIFKCHRFAQYPDYQLGNVATGIDKNKDYLKRIEDYHVSNPDCQTCSILPLCQQGCFAIQELYKEKINCEMKDVQKDLLLAYYKTAYGAD